MPHARETLRDAVVTAVTGLSTTGARVFADRPQARPLLTSELPALMVTTGVEVVEVASIHTAPMLNRELEIQVIACARSASGLDDTMDDIALEVETVLGGGSLASGKADIALVAIEAPVFDASGDMPVAQQTMRFRVSYATAANAPGTLI
jgi:hypothetical protein